MTEIAQRLRCLRTGNLVGTDTVMIGHPCNCQVCETADVIERLRGELHSVHAHMKHLRTGLSALRHVADVARDLVEECKPGIAPSLGTLAKLEDALHTEWKT